MLLWTIALQIFSVFLTQCCPITYLNILCRNSLPNLQVVRVARTVLSMFSGNPTQIKSIIICLQSPGPPFGSDAFLGAGAGRVVLVRAGATEGPEGRLMGRGTDNLSTLGQIQAQKAGELLMDLQVSASCFQVCSDGSPLQGRLDAIASVIGHLVCRWIW